MKIYLLQKASISEKRQELSFLYQKEISHQLHINLTPTSLHFLKVISPKDRKPKTKEDYL